MTSDDQDNLKEQILSCGWDELRPHLEAERLILISPDLDLVEVGAAVRDDDKDQVEFWVTSGKINKPSADEVKVWDQSPARVFRFLIVQPFVLMQESAH